MSKTILCADDSATMQKVAEITFGGSCDAFWSWIPRGCTRLERD